MTVSYSFRDVVICRFEKKAAILPEFRGEHPAIVVSTDNRSGLPLLVLPITSQQPEKEDPAIVELTPSPLPGKQRAWVVASHIYAVSVKRVTTAYQNKKKARVGMDRMRRIVDAMALRLPLEPKTTKAAPKDGQ